MKKAIVASILGIVAPVVFGQGIIVVNNYVTANYNTDQVVWGAGTGHSGTVQPADPVTVQLFYQVGTTSDTASSFLTDPNTKAGVSGPISSAYNGGGSYGVGTYGYYGLGNQLLTGWTAGTVTFEVVAWVGGSYATSSINGLSGLFTATDAVGTGPGIVSSSLPAHNFATMNGVTLAVPEPATIALGGLGLAALLAFRRKQV